MPMSAKPRRRHRPQAPAAGGPTTTSPARLDACHEAEAAEWDRVVEVSAGSFPASDPPAWLPYRLLGIDRTVSQTTIAL